MPKIKLLEIEKNGTNVPDFHIFWNEQHAARFLSGYGADERQEDVPEIDDPRYSVEARERYDHILGCLLNDEEYYNEHQEVMWHVFPLDGEIPVIDRTIPRKI